MAQSVYHLDLDEKKIKGAEYSLLPGDPFRSEVIAEEISKTYGTKREELAWKREYRTYLAEIAGAKVLITSTGIGGPSTAIAIDELAQLGVKTFLRVGTTGAIQPYINVEDVIISSGAVRLDGASTHYAPIEYPAVAHPDVLFALIESAKALQPNLKNRYHIGISVSSDTFYPGQERYDSFFKYVPRRFQGITEEWRRLNALNYEMETATVLTLCSALGLRGGSVTGVVVSRTKEEKINEKDLKLGEKNAIKVAIKAMEIVIKEDKREEK